MSDAHNIRAGQSAALSRISYSPLMQCKDEGPSESVFAIVLEYDEAAEFIVIYATNCAYSADGLQRRD